MKNLQERGSGLETKVEKLSLSEEMDGYLKSGKIKEMYIKARVKEITISMGPLEHSHGMDHKIREIYIPDEGIFFNSQACGMIHIGRYDDAKDVGDTQISKYFVEDLKKLIKGKEKLEGIQDAYKKALTLGTKIKNGLQ